MRNYSVDRIWSKAQLEAINNPKMVDILYDLNLLPEVILTHIRVAEEEERERCAKIAEPVDPVLASVIRKS